MGLAVSLADFMARLVDGVPRSARASRVCRLTSARSAPDRPPCGGRGPCQRTGGGDGDGGTGTGWFDLRAQTTSSTRARETKKRFIFGVQSRGGERLSAMGSGRPGRKPGHTPASTRLRPDTPRTSFHSAREVQDESQTPFRIDTDSAQLLARHARRVAQTRRFDFFAAWTYWAYRKAASSQGLTTWTAAAIMAAIAMPSWRSIRPERHQRGSNSKAVHRTGMRRNRALRSRAVRDDQPAGIA